MGDLQKVKLFCRDLGRPDTLRHLHGISELTKQTLAAVCNKYKDQESVQKVICLLLSRFLNPSMGPSLTDPFLQQSWNYLRGPVSVYHLTHPVYPQQYYLFGDTHILESKCPLPATSKNTINFEKWILDHLNNSPVFLDIYLETPYRHHGMFFEVLMDPTKTYLGIFHEQFLDCWEMDKDQCQFPTGRFHYGDIRAFVNYQSHTGKISVREGDYLLHFYDLMNFLNNKKLDLYYTLKKCPIFTKKAYDYFLIKHYLGIDRLVSKQMGNIANKDIKKIFLERYSQCKNIYHKIIRQVDVVKVINEARSIDDMKSGLQLFNLLLYMGCGMDFYLLARTFRRFKKRKDEYNLPSYNNIIYAGYAHVDKYVQVLLQLGYDLIYDRKSRKKGVDFQCVDISEMEQPMFSNRYKP